MLVFLALEQYKVAQSQAIGLKRDVLTTASCSYPSIVAIGTETQGVAVH